MEGPGLYALGDECHDEVKGSWEDRFETRYGFWQGTIEDAVPNLMEPRLGYVLQQPGKKLRALERLAADSRISLVAR